MGVTICAIGAMAEKDLRLSRFSSNVIVLWSLCQENPVVSNDPPGQDSHPSTWNYGHKCSTT